MKPGRWVQLVAVMVAVLCVAASTLLVKPINNQREDLQIEQVSRYGDTPKYALLAASMGTFRGLAADFLWYRAEKLKQEGKLFEANTTAEWITNLQPRFGQVWVFQSWNMAYNISVITHTAEERWDWVNKGIKLLRDEGIVYNPHNIAIYRQLGWTFFHKIGQRADDMNQYYKIMLAKEWQELLGAPTEGATKEMALERFKPIADAAKTYFPRDVQGKTPRDPFSLLYEKAPGTRDLVKRLRAIGYEPDVHCLREIGRIRMFDRYYDLRTLTGPHGDFLDSRGRKLYDLMSDPAEKDNLDTFLAFLRAKVLIEDYHMEPERMYALMERFGPMDWRHPGSQAIYWAATGIEKAGELRDKTKIDVLNTDRQIIHGLQMLMETGQIYYNPTTNRLDLTPDPRFIDAYGDAMVEANERQKNIDWAGNGNTKSFEQGHENFLLRAVLYSYLYGNVDKAQGYYKQLRDLYGQKPYNVNKDGISKYSVTLDDLVASEIQSDWNMTDQVARPWLEALLYSAFQKGLANANYSVYERFVQTAKTIEKKLIEQRKYDNAIAPDGQGRLIDWKSFDELIGSTYIKYLRSPNFDLFERAQVYQNSPANFRQLAYPYVIASLREQAKQVGLGDSIDNMFPAPPKAETGSSGTTDKTEKPKEPTGRESIQRD